ncbi:MAG: NDP-sugar synthase [Endomicrobiales bacterium]|nr:NDP-sugar synthase [Endomicrobiales bacterium]
MKAFVMAAGAGTRLRPLTYAIPKPMVPVVNKPVLEYTLENLKAHGIKHVALNLHNYPGVIRDHFGDGSKFGLSILYSYEKKLLGTAGGVKKVQKFFDSTFVVMSGDGLTDIDLTKAMECHKRKNALATMVLKPVDSKFEYGVTITDKEGRIREFIEKPKWSDVFANTVNTGIYIFEPEVLGHIPANQFYDFGLQLWPLLLKKRKRIFGYVMNEYWTDVGNLSEYRRGVRDVLDRKVRISLPGEQIRPGVWVGRGTKIEKGAVLKMPCVVGRNCLIGKNAVIGDYTTIADGSKIEPGAVVKNSILWRRVSVSRNVKLDNCIIGHGARISKDITVFEGTVLNIE